MWFLHLSQSPGRRLWNGLLRNNARMIQNPWNLRRHGFPPTPTVNHLAKRLSLRYA